MTNISKKVKAARVLYGLTQKELAASMTVTQSYICQIEAGKEVPTPMFIKLFNILYPVDNIMPDK